MKNFIATFIISYIILFLSVAFMIENFWFMIFSLALVLAVLITAFISQEAKTEELGARIKELELKQEHKEEVQL
ncbi:MAG: hypothetical protein GX829_07925 [Clostridium sp.]|jgi:ABC-type protease/lipase transport system fused ATPase/permease subunit|nr:hypothetical protein [Clostridium sp.]